MKLEQLFGNKRILGLAGNKNSGKTNNLFYLIQEFRKTNTTTPIYGYGFPVGSYELLNKLRVQPLSDIEEMSEKENCIIIVDEFQKLKLNDRRYKDELAMFKNFVYHNNVYTILSSPDPREFNSVIGGIIEKWLLKNLKETDCINGSQLKNAVISYQGVYKVGHRIKLPPQTLLVNGRDADAINCTYVEGADTKKDNINIFASDVIVTKKSKKLSKNCQRLLQ